MSKKYDVIVVGGGYPGCSIAYHLSKAGQKVLLVEKKEIASGASGGNFGCIQVQDANPGLSLELTLRSYQKVMQFQEELNRDLELKEIGSLIGAVTELEMRELTALYEIKKAAGMDIRLLGSREIHEIEPHLNASLFLGATYYRQGRLNPFALMYGFVSKGREYGLEVREYCEVTDFYQEGGSVKGVILAGNELVRSEYVVIAAGAWTKTLARLLGMDLPIEYVKAEAFLTERLEPVLFNYYSAASFFAEAHGTQEAGMSLCIAQTQSGNLLIGETSKPGNGHPDLMSNCTSQYHCSQVKEKISRFLPVLEDAQILRSWVTASPFTESMEPILGPIGPPGIMVASGFKSCVIMTAVVGEIITDLIVRGQTFCDLTLYRQGVHS